MTDVQPPERGEGEEVQVIALYAILLREAARNHHTGAEAHLDDAECCRDELSLATLAAGARFSARDWELAELLYDGADAAVFQEARDLLAEDEASHAETLLHAHGKRPRAEWGRKIAERWDDVRAAIAMYEADGIAIKFGDVDLVADLVYRNATGTTQEEADALLNGELAHA
jgi:hypothetical protein